MSEHAGFVVVDIWKVKPGKQDELNAVLAECGERFWQVDGILSVDYTRMIDDPDRYLVIFRYRSAEDREAFVAADDLRSTMQRLAELWDLESPIWQGQSI